MPAAAVPVAMQLARLNMDIVDFGVPLLSMHAPFEIASKAVYLFGVFGL